MTHNETLHVSEQFTALLPDVVHNYLDILKLPKKTKVLLITDAYDSSDRDILSRRALIQALSKPIRSLGHSVIFLEFDVTTPANEMVQQVQDRLATLNKWNKEKYPTTIIYAGADWENKQAIFDVIKEFSSRSNGVWLANSSGVTHDEIMAMSKTMPGIMEFIQDRTETEATEE